MTKVLALYVTFLIIGAGRYEPTFAKATACLRVAASAEAGGQVYECGSRVLRVILSYKSVSKIVDSSTLRSTIISLVLTT